jgi:hypothetical protein
LLSAWVGGGVEPGAAVVSERVKLSKIDAQTGLSGDQAFTNVAGALTAPGQLHLVRDSANHRTFIEGNVDGNLNADFRIEVTGHPAFDFLL